MAKIKSDDLKALLERVDAEIARVREAEIGLGGNDLISAKTKRYLLSYLELYRATAAVHQTADDTSAWNMVVAMIEAGGKS